MSKEKFVSNFFETLWMEREVSIVDEKCSDNIITHYSDKKNVGKNDQIKIAENWFKAFPSRDSTRIEEIGEKEDLFYVKWNSSVKHEGIFWDLTPTGKTVDCKGICFYRIRDDLITEHHCISDVDMALISYGSFPMNDPVIDKYNIGEVFSVIRSSCNTDLTNREIEVTSLWLSGYSIKESARILKITPRTIEEYLLRIKAKLNVNNKRCLYDLIRYKKVLDMFLSFSGKLALLYT